MHATARGFKAKPRVWDFYLLFLTNKEILKERHIFFHQTILYRVGEVMHFSIFYYLVYIIMLRYYILTTWPPPHRPRTSNLIIDAIKNAPIIIVVYEKCGMCLRTICAICSLKQCSCYFSMR